MENKEKLVRVLGLKESISMTIGTVVGVGLFTCGSTQIGLVGPYIIVFTFISLLVSIWPCLIYGEMSAALPLAGGTYNFARRGLNNLWANMSGWHYIISVVAIGAGETLAFSNYFKILLEQFGINIEWLDSRIIACVLVAFFLLLNYRGIKTSAKAQTAFVFFFWGCSVTWFFYMIPNVHLEYFGEFSFKQLPTFNEMMYIFGFVWWCYTGFETCVSTGSETKFPQYTLPRALKISVALVFAVNALFQWFLVGLVSPQFYGVLANADAPYAEGLKAVGLVGFPVILLCIGIAFGGDLSTINPGIAAPARYIYTMAENASIPSFFGRIHKEYKTPHVAVILVGIINFILISTGSIDYIASVSLISLAICYMIGCAAYLGLKIKYPNLRRPYIAPYGKFGCYLTFVIYTFMLLFADKNAILTAIFVSLGCLVYWILYCKKRVLQEIGIEEELGEIEKPTVIEKTAIDNEYKIWKWSTIVITIISLALYLIPIIL